MKGDDQLSGFDLHMWHLVYSTLVKFGVVTIFKVHGPNVPQKQNQDIWWFIPYPADSPEFLTIEQYIRTELQDEIKDRNEKLMPGEEWFWSTTLEVFPFSGMEPYLEREISRKMAADAVKEFMRTLEQHKRVN